MVHLFCACVRHGREGGREGKDRARKQLNRNMASAAVGTQPGASGNAGAAVISHTVGPSLETGKQRRVE